MEAAVSTTPSSSTRPALRPWVWRVILVVVGLGALRFYARDPLHYLLHYTPASFGGYWEHRHWLLLHIAGATVALVVGPFQLWSGFRRRHVRLHRALGLTYLGAAAVGGFGAFGLALWSRAVDRGVSVFVFAVAWWLCLFMAYRAIRSRRILEHQDWMVRGYVLTYGFVTIRALTDIPIWGALGAVAEPTANWLGWVGPLLLSDMVLRWRRGSPLGSRATGAP